MEDIFGVMGAKKVTELMEERFTGYINSPMCAPMLLGEMYELKRMMKVKAKDHEHRSLKVTTKQG